MDLRAFTEQMRRLQADIPEARKAALRKAAEIVRDEAKDLIGTEGEAWPPLADATVEEKQRLGFTGKVSSTDPLLRTGELHASIQVGEVTSEHAIVGTDDPIAPFQEFGTQCIPPRPFIGAAVLRSEHLIEHEIATVMVHSLQGNRE